MQVPLDVDYREIRDLPYTMSFVIRKRIQMDNLNELPKEKRPPESVLWSSNPDHLDDWLEKVMKIDKSRPKGMDSIKIPQHMIE